MLVLHLPHRIEHTFHLDLQPIVLLLQAKVEVSTEVPIKFHARLIAYLLTSDQVLKLQQWDPASHVLTEGIVGGVSAATIVCTDKHVSESDGTHSFKGSSVLTFRGKTAVTIACHVCPART